MRTIEELIAEYDITIEPELVEHLPGFIEGHAAAFGQGIPHAQACDESAGFIAEFVLSEQQRSEGVGQMLIELGQRLAECDIFACGLLKSRSK